jgi:hypothetical protein
MVTFTRLPRQIKRAPSSVTDGTNGDNASGNNYNSVIANSALHPLKQSVYLEDGVFRPWKGVFKYQGANARPISAGGTLTSDALRALVSQSVKDLDAEYSDGIAQALVFSNLSYSGFSMDENATVVGNYDDRLYFPRYGFKVYLTASSLAQWLYSQQQAEVSMISSLTDGYAFTLHNFSSATSNGSYAWQSGMY